MLRLSVAIFALCVATTSVFAAEPWRAPSSEQVEAVYPMAEALYLDLHEHPELSLHEVQTAAKLAKLLRGFGYDVTENFGGNGVVAVLKNGDGPVIMFRSDMDALPVDERTGVSYASKVRVKDDHGMDVPVMHACGHDVHMALAMGTMALMAKNKAAWKGTLVFIGQPAEEVIGGAKNMLAAGLLTKFPRPEYILGVHDSANQPAGTVGFTSGFALANSDTVNVTIFGRGGHGSSPQTTVDPIVIAARTVMAWQTIVSRENNPLDPAVVTVGTIHGGAKNNIIPDEVNMGLTVRSYKPEVRAHLLASIKRIAEAESLAAGASKAPLVEFADSTSAVYNDPKLTQRIVGALNAALGTANVVEQPPVMVAEDFGEYGSSSGIPSLIFWVGGVNAEKYAAAKKSGDPLPSLHSSLWAPDYKPTLKTGITAEVAALLEVLGRP